MDPSVLKQTGDRINISGTNISWNAGGILAGANNYVYSGVAGAETVNCIPEQYVAGYN